MAGLLTLTVLNSKKLRDTLDTAFSSEEKKMEKLIESSDQLVESLGSDKDSAILLALKSLLKVRRRILTPR